MIINIRKFLIMRAVLAAAVLAIPAGGAGLPGEYLVTQRWRALNNPYSPLNNPANIAAENYLSVRSAVAPVLQGAFTFSEIGVNVPISLYQTAGFNMLMESAGAVYEDAFDENTGKLIPNTEKPLSNSNFLFSFVYARHVWQRLVVGANINFAYQTNFGAPLKGMGIDLGAGYRLYKHPVFGEHIVGIATENLIAPTMNISWTPNFDSPAEYARNLRLSDNSTFWRGRIHYGADFVLKDFFATAKFMPWEFNHKLGVDVLRIFKLYGLVSFDENVIGDCGFAFSARPSGFFNISGIRSIEAMYQYNVMTEENSDATSHSFYVRMELGKHREEVFAGK